MTAPRLMRFENFVEINPRVRLQKGDEYPFIDMKLLIPDSRYVRPQNGRNFTGGGAKFQNQDTLFARITPCLENGKIAQVIDLPSGMGFGSTEFFVFRAIPKISVPAYVYYLASTPIIRGPAEKSMSGASGRQRADLSAIQELDVLVPDVQTQQQIATILSAYDDLIENNLRRIRILEEMAQNLYREWFVKFRFPGHEQVRMVDSPLGKIPEGWGIKTLGDVAVNFDRLRKPLSKMQRAERRGIYPYYGAAKIFDYIDDYIFDGIYLLMAEDGSVVTPSRKPVLQYVTGKFWVNNHTHILQGADGMSTEHLFLALSDINVTGYITGAAQPKITQANLNRIPVIVADDSLLDSFNEIVSGIFRQRVSLLKKNKVLRQTRDLLLPKLISGELDVSKLDIDIREAA